MPFIAITRLRVRSWRFLPAFFVQTLRAAFQAKGAEGSLAVCVLGEAHKTFWTCTVWSSEHAMRAFMLSPPHRQVMRYLGHWCDEASIAHWTQDSPHPPSWEDAHRHMQKHGRASIVKYPTEAHNAWQIPAPKVRRGGILRFK